MNKIGHALLQGALALVSYGAVITGVVPHEYKGVAVAAIALIQAVLALVNHDSGKQS